MRFVVETISIKSSIIQYIQKREIIQWRGRLIPLVRLNATYDSRDENPDHPDNILIVVVSSDSGHVGLVIDEVLELQETVVISPGSNCRGVEGIAGATILGDGRAALILDVNSLIQR